MDPVAASTTFATIIGLVCNYAAEQRSEADTFAGFMEYLRKSHDEIRRSIEDNTALAQALSALLSQNTEEVIKKLEKLDTIFAGVAANLEDFRAISAAVYREALSEEAISILNKFYDSGAGQFLEKRCYGFSGIVFLPLHTGGESLEIGFYRFLEADLKTLHELGFLKLDHQPDFGKVHVLTRQAERYIKAMRETASSRT